MPSAFKVCNTELWYCVLMLTYTYSIYYYCSYKPLQAYDFGLMAAMKVQNLWKRYGTQFKSVYSSLMTNSLPPRQNLEETEQIARTYWAILLLERLF